MKNKFSTLFASAICAISCQVHAFKIDTHVWIGQQVINDIADDGMIQIQLDNRTIKLPVDESVVNAILTNQSDFLMGNIGPDATPDVVVGQTLVHPGNENKNYWQTNDWMEYLLENQDYSDTAKAFTYGYLGHASADVFAHTYVNQYSGDIFALFDKEQLVERRHFVLEGYISEHLPPLLNKDGLDLGQEVEQITLDEEYARFINDILIMNPEVARQYASSPFAGYLAGLYYYREAINEIAENNIWHVIDTIATIIMVSEWFEEDLSFDEASFIVTAAQPVVDALNEDVIDGVQELTDSRLLEYGRKYRTLGFNNVAKALDSYQSAKQELLDKHYEFELEAVELANKVAQQSCALIEEAFLAPIGVHEYIIRSLPFGERLNNLFIDSLDPHGLLDINSLQDLLDPAGLFDDDDPEPIKLEIETRTKNDWERELLRQFNDWGVSNIDAYGTQANIRLRIGGEGNTSHVKRTYSIYNAINSATENSLISIYDSNYNHSGISTESDFILCDAAAVLQEEVIRSLHIKHKLEEELIKEQTQTLENVNELEVQLLIAEAEAENVLNAIINLSQNASGDVSAFQSYLRAWRDDLDQAILNYTIAASQSMLNTIDSSEDVSAIEPMETWFNCHMGTLLGINGTVSSCEFRESLSNLLTAIEDILFLASSNASPPGLPDYQDEILELQRDIRERLVQELREYVAEEIEDFIPPEVQEMIELVDTKIDARILNSEFSRAEYGEVIKNLVMIPDMSSRVNAEMHVTNGLLNPEAFAPIRNAIVLAKLALLDEDGLRVLENAVNAPGQLTQTHNLVATAFTNIDGNHQWMDHAPPRPNSKGAPYHYQFDYEKGVDLGPQVYHTDQGFLPWKESLRKKLFRSLFIGPLSPGIDSPELIGMNSVLKSDYPYQPCYVNPYPVNEEDRTCTVSWLIPILSILN
ncbi:zinc dependent phospholipase C family protein [Marinibactrum halimedae]|uniref:Phospholipase C/D domain-containing protein n=1 Tax=Marinibactrum halimedae TaxID=1444977 RepID=A0AA37WNY7_9GAMM|nr:zinc dependent phospholipase C family protein [Marinibactrum halimedae]MCD9460540.1 zinc dependent phospholipase C family protein [Marinibactrum halimedae]GLS27903.1 hypothetical protein GCM10007877_36220 [Marinibactrum halimedae]